MAKFTDEDDALLAELGVEVEAKKVSRYTPQQERVIAGFEDIQRFVDEHKRIPEHGENNDIFERLYAVRLERLKSLSEFQEPLAPIDYQGLLSGGDTSVGAKLDDMDDDALLAELGIEAIAPDITTLKHVRSSAEIRAAEEIANRERCKDFETFKPLFEQVQKELYSGIRETRPFKDDARIELGHWFILSGQKVFVADVGEEFVADYGRKDRRLRVIYDNATESNMLKRSLERALQKDEAGRRITDPTAGPLFADQSEDGDLETGTIYVLRSKSDNPIVAKNRDVLHKIGVTGGKVEARLTNAKLDPTFLLADVEIIATYKLANINRTKLENLIHRIFGHARLDIEIKDRFGNPITPREWFIAPLFVIDEAVRRIKDGTITSYIYDPKTARLVNRGRLS
ncbi:GIY-YIG nuclease family protein [Devosia honganensis]|uniref:GIY-YIG nuclease family protein n=1 Tax=Devosia honganensis TaxID=1610527 RepID=A0ABV7X4F3_9HYPH